MEKEAPCVLVVDDDENIAFALSRALEARGCRVLTAWSSETALVALEDVEPSVALLDIVLPGMDGLQLASEIKSRWPDCEIVMITGRSSVETVVEAIRAGAFDYLAKPFGSLDDVWMAVERALAKRAALKLRRSLGTPSAGGTYEDVQTKVPESKRSD
jgi:two-component system NtrC family response regulator